MLLFCLDNERGKAVEFLFEFERYSLNMRVLTESANSESNCDYINLHC